MGTRGGIMSTTGEGVPFMKDWGGEIEGEVEAEAEV
jgi:hypothetical protein